jgi:D-alanyl-lipoteichoic acid acyltransferase DltB (MBOAT superfamily)
MLFNSLTFLFGFLPVTWLIFFLCARARQPALSWWSLLGASWFFYAWQVPWYLPLLLGLTGWNYAIGEKIRRTREQKNPGRFWLIGGVASNLAVLAFFKYSLFLSGPLQRLFGTHAWTVPLLLPLGISFHTFQQIAWLVDTWRGRSERCTVRDYFLFVCFFPQLIAGPIVQHHEMLAQFRSPDIFQPRTRHLFQGLTLIVLGLFKKMILADVCAISVDRFFLAVMVGAHPTFFEAWSGALAYSFQIYFDFSAYSDLAIGLALLFNLRLPLNFDSPYRATSVIEFWRCWHITLSRFLRDYLYIPLGGNRCGPIRNALNLFLTMTLAGVWHGAGWNFVLWGVLHGIFLMVNHLWRKLPDFGPPPKGWRWGATVGSWTLTLVAVVQAWVLFRSPNLPTAWRIWQGMAGANGIAWASPQPTAPGPVLTWLKSWGWQIRPPSLEFYFQGGSDILFLAFLTAIVLVLPNSATWTETRFFARPAPDRVFPWRWQPNWTCGLFLGILVFLIARKFFEPMAMNFIYFNF